MDGGEGFRERRGHVGSVRQGRWRMLPIGCLSVMYIWCTERQPLLQAMRHIANDFDNLYMCEDDKLVLVLVRVSYGSLALVLVSMWQINNNNNNYNNNNNSNNIHLNSHVVVVKAMNMIKD